MTLDERLGLNRPKMGRLYSPPILGGARRVLSLDMDAAAVHLVLARVTGAKASIVQAATANWPEGMDQQDAAAVGRFVRQVMDEKKMSAGGMVMALPRREVILQPVQLPEGTPNEEVAAMARFQAGKQLPIASEEAVIDFTYAAHFDGGVAAGEGQGEEAFGTDRDMATEVATPGALQVLIAAVPRERVAYYEQLAEAANVKLLALTPRPWASWRCLGECLPTGVRQDDEIKGGVKPGDDLVLVHLLDEEVEITVIHGDQPAFSRSVKLTGKSRAGRLAREVDRSLHGYQSVHRAASVATVMVAGATGRESAVAAELGESLGVPGHVFAPSTKLAGKASGVDGGHIAAMGLALGYAEGLALDLVNPKQPPPPANPRPRQLMMAAAAAAVILIILIGHHLYIGGREAELADLRTEYKGLIAQDKQVKKLARHVSYVDNWLSVKRPWLAHFAYLSAILPPADQAYLRSLRSNSDGTYTLAIQARQAAALTTLSDRLAEAGYHLFKFGPIHPVKDQFGYPISAELRVVLPAGMKIDLKTVTPPERGQRDIAAAHFAKLAAEHQARRENHGRGRRNRHEGQPNRSPSD